MNKSVEEGNNSVSDFCLVSVINVAIATFNVFDKLMDSCLFIAV